jgi:hypothetical protein
VVGMQVVLLLVPVECCVVFVFGFAHFAMFDVALHLLTESTLALAAAFVTVVTVSLRCELVLWSECRWCCCWSPWSAASCLYLGLRTLRCLTLRCTY